MKRCFLRLLVILFYSIFIQASFHNEIEQFLRRYTRDVTFLEIAYNNIDFSINNSNKLGYKTKVVNVGIVVSGNGREIAKHFKQNNIDDIVVLNRATSMDLEILTRCEPFDVVVMHDLFEHYNQNWQYVLHSVTNLADHVFFRCNIKNLPKLFTLDNTKLTKVNQNQNEVLYLYSSPKLGLELARFTQFKKPRTTEFPYRIQSDFSKKLFSKDTSTSVTNMIPGINLMTFIMLYGVYPTDDIIISQIERMAHMRRHHNDLMMGNMVVQGNKVVPIDFKDGRRNADMKKCIARAVRFFRRHRHERFRNPYDCIQEYYQTK